MLRIIAGVEPFEGERTWGHNVEESFYAQHQLESLDVYNTVLDEMKNAGSQQQTRNYETLLGCFLFSGEEVEKKIKVSVGRKSPRSSCKTMW